MNRRPSRRLPGLLASLALLAAAAPAAAERGGQLLATGGISTIEGGAGGGIVPWAVLAGYGTESQYGATAFTTRVGTGDYTLQAYGAAATWRNRVEVSVARQTFDLGTLRGQLGLPSDVRLSQNVIGAKVRLFGDLLYGDLPQVSAGLQYKRNTDTFIPAVVGADDNDGVDAYISASRLWVAGPGGRSLLVNATLRSTQAMQQGLLGFHDGSRDLVVEASAALLLNRYWAVGVEYRQKPDELAFAREDDWQDVFVAWFPRKSIAVAAAWVDLGSIAGIEDQQGWVLSLQTSL